VQFLPQQNFDCHQCGKCCAAGWHIPVDEASAQGIRENYAGHGLRRRPHYLELALRKDGTCHFLDRERHLCGLHERFGAEAKPKSCRQFPFEFNQTPAGVFVGVSFFCPSVAHNQGRPLSEWASHIEGLLDEIEPLQEPFPVHARVGLTWKAYLELETFLRRNLPGSFATAVELMLEPLRSARQRQEVWDQLPFELPSEAAPPSVPDSLLERYLEGLLFRKFLLERPLFHQLCLLREVIGQLVQALDLYRAIEQCEFSQLTHAQPTDLAKRARQILRC
jgi:Fe-S-cluster containining protein